jgi:hypothetical protein
MAVRGCDELRTRSLGCDKCDDITARPVAPIRDTCLQLLSCRGYESSLAHYSLAFAGFVQAVFGLPMSSRGQLLA